DGERLWFSVKDNGVGFDPEQAERLFEPFHQGDASTTRRFGGTGLGLAVCRGLLERMGGGITAHGVPGVGADFQFHIPLARSERPVSPGGEKKTRTTLREVISMEGLVLLAEDNPINSQLAILMLGSMGVRAHVATNGQEVLERLRSGADYRAVLMDVRMPEMDGLEATRRIRDGEAGKQWREIPIIAITANTMPADEAACREAGMTAYLSKPLRSEELQEALARAGLLAAGEL
ncbi:MAG: response regulator, partial [Akkermansiaceae bacterium]|nr:response regulator [Akkermansiaceae bacterium]